jgi:hypothetical protein
VVYQLVHEEFENYNLPIQIIAEAISLAYKLKFSKVLVNSAVLLNLF